MANPGTPDTNTSEFFVTDVGQQLADMPQYLNFRHSIFGQLTSGFDIYQKIMNAEGITASNSTPTVPVTIQSAQIIDDTQNGVVQITGPSDYVGTTTITVTAVSTDGTTSTQSFEVDMAPANTTSDKQPLILAPVQDLTTTEGAAISFTVTVQESSGISGDVAFSVTDAATFNGTPANVTVQVTSTGTNTATITLTPAAGFSGTINLLTLADNNTYDVHDAQPFSLTVQAATQVAISDVPSVINSDNAADTSISGTGNAGDSITVLVSDGTNSTSAYTTTVDDSGSWTISGIDVTGLNDGSLTYTATATNSANETAVASSTVTKDTQPPALAITQVTDPINGGSASTVTISGTGEIGATITVTASDGTNTTTQYQVTVSQNGTWTISGIDTSGLADGSIEFTAIAADDAGNTTEQTASATKDTVAPQLAISGVTDPITLANVTSTSASGTGEVGATISVVVTDGTNSTTAYTTTVGGDGTWSIADIDVSSLADGTLTYQVTANDTAGNETSDTATATKSAIAITMVTDPVNAANAANTSASGTGQAGATVTLVVSDGTNSTTAYTTTIDDNGTWSIENIDVSSLADGPITYTVTATDTQEHSAQSTRTVTKDTTPPEVQITQTTDPVNASNSTGASISGTSEAGATISVVVSDGTNSTAAVQVTVAGDGTWTISGINLSSLADGTITYQVTATDTAGNASQASLDATKDTVAPDVAISSVTDPVQLSNANQVSISGTGEVGATISVVVTDGASSTAAVTTTVARRAPGRSRASTSAPWPTGRSPTRSPPPTRPATRPTLRKRPARPRSS